MTTTHHRAPRSAVAVLAALLLTALAASGCSLVPEAATDRTDAWDPQVLEIARQVERLRGLEFERPVRVRFLPPAKFDRSLRTEADDLGASDRRELARSTNALRSLGLIGPAVDLLAVGNDSTGTLGYYDPGTDRITMPTGRITPAAKVTLAHELTHALQDQVFDIAAVERRGSRAALATTAVFEGDATRTEDRYRETLPRPQRRRSYDDAPVVDADPGATADLPDALVLRESAPYELGPLMVEQAKYARVGGVNGLYRRPPRSERPLVTPWAFHQGTGVRAVADPPLAAGETRRGRTGRIDAHGLYLLLASRLGPDRALAAADRYGGDAWMLVDRAGTPCSRITVRSVSRAGAPVLQQAVADWAAAMPVGVASATSDGRFVTLTSCDDGSSAGPMPGGSAAVTAFVWDRNDTYRYVAAYQPVSVARCAADQVVRDPVNATFSYLRETRTTEAEVDAFFARTDEIVEECGGVTR